MFHGSFSLLCHCCYRVPPGRLSDMGVMVIMVAYMLGSIVICHHNISCASNDALYTRLCTYSSGVRTKFGIDMVLLGELRTTRSSKEG